MTKIYRYDETYEGTSGEEIVFSVEFISDGNYGPTRINIPGPNDGVIANAGKRSLGKIDSLISEKTITVSDIANPIPEEDTITIAYYINGKLLLKHSNTKNVSDTPMIIITITFAI